jgi:hypothetical protein
MKCKVRLDKITRTASGYELTYLPVTSGSQENQTFFKYTPYGQIHLGTINENVVRDLERGKDYYVVFTEAM